MNAISRELRGGLTEAWDDFNSDDDLWVAIVKGAGERAFYAGMDMKEHASSDTAGPSGQKVEPLNRKSHDALAARSRSILSARNTFINDW